MGYVSTARKLGLAARVAGKQMKRSRTYGALLTGARTSLSHFGKVLHQLWLEVTGFVFLAFAAIGVVALVKEYAAYRVGHATSGKVAAAAGFSLLFAWFGTSSFWRARAKK
jgi:hypothetical protein